jgi:DNA repair exonuclease SbcCD nuclease subunit
VKSFRFIHTGDIHLDSPLKGLSGQQGAAAERIRTATRAAFDNLVTQAIEERVTFIIIAGDLYDGDWRDYQTGLFFVRQMGRLAQANIQVFLLYGNHDAESQITRRLILPPNVRVFSWRRPITFFLEEHAVALHGQSFRQRDIAENLASAYPGPTAGCFNIGVLHTGLGGIGGHANYAPCALEDLTNKGYDYWALAHVHQAAVLCERPHVAFCGNLQGRNARESGPKGASLVSVEEGQIAEISSLHVDVVRWSHLRVLVDQCRALADVVDVIRRAIEDAVEHVSQGRLLACRIELTGQTELHGELLASTEQILADTRAAALGLGEEVAWIERLVIATESAEVATSRKDALGDLQRLICSAADDADLRTQLASELGEMIRKLPHEVRVDPEDVVLKAAIEGDTASLITHAGRYLTARLSVEKV